MSVDRDKLDRVQLGMPQISDALRDTKMFQHRPALRIHITFLLLIAWLAFGYYAQGGSAVAASRVIFVLLLFLCVVLHEFGHAFAAKAFGINTPDITLLPIGGVARLERMPEEPVQELIIAVAGPLVNV